MLNSKARDLALDNINNSDILEVQAESIGEAVDKFTGSKEFENFLKGRRSVYFYNIDDNGEPNLIY